MKLVSVVAIAKASGPPCWMRGLLTKSGCITLPIQPVFRFSRISARVFRKQLYMANPALSSHFEGEW